MATFGVKRTSDEPFCPITVQIEVFHTPGFMDFGVVLEILVLGPTNNDFVLLLFIVRSHPLQQALPYLLHQHNPLHLHARYLLLLPDFLLVAHTREKLNILWLTKIR